MNYKFLCCLLAMACGMYAFGQQPQKLSLQDVVWYAMQHNITVKQQQVAARNDSLTYTQSKKSIYPNLSFSASASINAGNNQDPTTFSRITESYFTNGIQLQSDVMLYNFGARKYSIDANKLQMKASNAAAQQTAYDAGLAAANSFLNILLSKEQEKIALTQLATTTEQLRVTKIKIQTGVLPPLDSFQVVAQLGQDSLNYYTTLNNTANAYLQLKQTLSMPAETPIEIDAPNTDSIPLKPLAQLMPETVYEAALKNRPAQQQNILALQAAQKQEQAAKAQQYPTLSAFAGLGSNYNNKSQSLVGGSVGVTKAGYVTVGGTTYDTYQRYFQPQYKKATYFTQLGDNFRQSAGISLSVPIFNGGTLKTAYVRSKLNVLQTQLKTEADNLKLKQDIYQAYNDAVAAYHRYNAGIKSFIAQQEAYSLAKKRFEVGMLSTVDLLTIQNKALGAALDNTRNKYDYIFKLKVLEYYKGEGL